MFAMSLTLSKKIFYDHDLDCVDYFDLCYDSSVLLFLLVGFGIDDVGVDDVDVDLVDVDEYLYYGYSYFYYYFYCCYE